MSRWKAAAVHSAISTTIALLVAALLFGLWYPPPFFHAGGADELVLLLVGVDLAVGPLLTAIVFRSGKRGLRFDLATIGILQAMALLYGMYVVLRSRPIFLVAEPDRFVLVPSNEIDDQALAQGREPAFRSRSWTGPRLVAAELPTDLNERNELVFGALAGGDIDTRPKYYRPYAEGESALLKNAKPLAALIEVAPEHAEDIAQAVSNLHRKQDDIVWVPLEARNDDLVMLLDAHDAHPLRALAIEPWSTK